MREKVRGSEILGCSAGRQESAGVTPKVNLTNVLRAGDAATQVRDPMHLAFECSTGLLENFKQNKKKHVSEHQNVNNSNVKDTNVNDTLLIKYAQNIHSEIELLQKHLLVMVYSY